MEFGGHRLWVLRNKKLIRNGEIQNELNNHFLSSPDAMLSGYLPFSSESGSQSEMFDLIMRGKYAFPEQDWSEISEEGEAMID